MNDLRRELHTIVDRLPDSALEHARTALDYVAAPERHRMTIERAKERARQNSERHLREWAERTGRGFISGVGSGGGTTAVDGTHHTSMAAFADGRDATYHLYLFRGCAFEILETVEVSENGERIIRRERITGADGHEHVLTVELPARPAR
jgi:hypothetical protein